MNNPEAGFIEADKPDLRNPIKMDDVTDAFAGSGFSTRFLMRTQSPSPSPGSTMPLAFLSRYTLMEPGSKVSSTPLAPLAVAEAPVATA